jgi:hypothetical protein
VSLAIHPTFKQAIYPKNNPKKHKGMMWPLTLDEAWDPLIITQRLLKMQYGIRLLDMNQEPIESYKLGEKRETKARGNCWRNEKTMEDEDEDNQEIRRPPKREKTTNGKSHHGNTEKTGHNENTEMTGETQTEDQDEDNDETSDQEEQNKAPDETAEILKDIICKNLKKRMQTNTRCTPEVIK